MPYSSRYLGVVVVKAALSNEAIRDSILVYDASSALLKVCKQNITGLNNTCLAVTASACRRRIPLSRYYTVVTSLFGFAWFRHNSDQTILVSSVVRDRRHKCHTDPQ